MNEQLLPNPYKRIEQLEQSMKVLGTWARVDIANRKDAVKRSMPRCLRPEDVAALVDKVMGVGA